MTTFYVETLASWSRSGEVFGVETRVTNKGPPLADSFVLTEHHRLTSTGETGCHYVKVAKLDFLKYSLLKVELEHQYSTILLTIKFSQGKIESETWAGIAKAEEVLEDKFHDIDDNNKNQRGKTKKKTEKQKHSTTAVKTSKIPSINFYPENWRVRELRNVISLSNFVLFLVDRSVHPRSHPGHTNTGGRQPLQDGLHPG